MAVVDQVDGCVSQSRLFIYDALRHLPNDMLHPWQVASEMTAGRTRSQGPGWDLSQSLGYGRIWHQKIGSR